MSATGCKSLFYILIYVTFLTVHFACILSWDGHHKRIVRLRDNLEVSLVWQPANPHKTCLPLQQSL